MSSASGWDGFRHIEFGDATRSPSGSVARGEHWATIGRRVAVRAPVGRFLPDCPVAERLAAGPLFAIQTAWLIADAGTAQVRKNTNQTTFLRPGCQVAAPRRSQCAEGGFLQPTGPNPVNANGRFPSRSP